MEQYYEKDLVINNRELRYSGIFRISDLFMTINRILDQKGYVKREKKSEELVTESGRKLYFELRPYLETTNYVTIMIKIKISIDDMTDKVVDDIKYQKGDIWIAFDAWFMTDSQSRWTQKPWVFFLKGMINKYIYTWPLEAGFRDKVTGDTAAIYGQLRTLFKSYHPEHRQLVKEDEIMKEIAKEVEMAEKENKNPNRSRAAGYF